MSERFETVLTVAACIMSMPAIFVSVYTVPYALGVL